MALFCDIFANFVIILVPNVFFLRASIFVPDCRRAVLGYTFSARPLDWLPDRLNAEALEAFLEREFDDGWREDFVYDGRKRLYVREGSASERRIEHRRWIQGKTTGLLARWWTRASLGGRRC